MKLLLLLGFVALASAAYEPKEGDRLCKMCGDPLVRTYDRNWKLIKDIGKFRLSNTKDTTKRCKFEVDCVIQSTYFWDKPATEPLFLDWCGIAMWRGTNDDKFHRNWIFGQSLQYVGERGTQIKGTTCRKVPRYFPRPNEKIGQWNKKTPRPQESECAGWQNYPRPWVYCVTRDNNVLQFRSNPDCHDCLWAIDWVPCGRGTCINIWAQDGNPNFPGKMAGICQNMNDNPDDEDICCGGQTGCDDGDIVASCKGTDKDGLGFPGGTKLHSACGPEAALPCLPYTG